MPQSAKPSLQQHYSTYKSRYQNILLAFYFQCILDLIYVDHESSTNAESNNAEAPVSNDVDEGLRPDEETLRKQNFRRHSPEYSLQAIHCMTGEFGIRLIAPHSCSYCGDWWD